MAASDARPVPQKNVAYRVTFPILDADGDLVTGAAGLDSEVSKDGDTFADCTNEATEIATNSGMYFLDLTSTEMNADTVAIIVKTSTSGAKTTAIVLYPEESGDIRVNVTAFGGTAGTFSGGRPEVNTSHAAGTAWNSGAIGAATLAADTLTAAKVAADVGTEIAGAVRTELTTELGRIDAAITTRASAADMTTALGYIDTEIAAILEDTGTTIPAQIDALEAHGDATWSTATGFSTHSADDVWSVAVRVLTASTNLGDLDDAVLAVLGTPAGASMADDIANIQAGSGPTAEQIADEVETRTLDANVVKVNNVTVDGAGTEGDPWGPA
jgi:hypothetical protein